MSSAGRIDSSLRTESQVQSRMPVIDTAPVKPASGRLKIYSILAKP